MILENLTQRAKNVLLNFKNLDTIDAGSLISKLEESDGMAALVLKSVQKFEIKNATKLNVNELVTESYYQALKMDSVYVGTEHILLALLKLINSSSYKPIRVEILKLSIFPTFLKTFEKAKKSPILDTYSINLNLTTLKNLDKSIIFRREYDALISSLIQQNNSNVLLVGDAGVGKETLVELLARNISFLDVPVALAGYQIIEFDLLGYMTNVLNKNVGDLGLVNLIEELKVAGRVILYIKDLQNVFFSTSTGFTVPLFFTMLKSAIESSNVRIIATMSGYLYDKISLENAHIMNGFSVISLNEPDEETLLEILKVNSNKLSKHHNVKISDSTIKYVLKKAKEDNLDNKLPQKALNLLDHACSRLILKKSKIPEKYKKNMDSTFLLAQNLDKQLENRDYTAAGKTRTMLKKIDQNLTRLENSFLSPKSFELTTKEIDEAINDMKTLETDRNQKINIKKLTTLASRIKKRIIGQMEAVDVLVRAMIRSELGLRPRKRPIGNFLFLGPTGVGKTELAKVLASEHFGDRALIRLDMSDFGEKHHVSRLIGAPPGYIGYGEGGELTNKISQNPSSVVLFDEIEKAHPDVLNILLQIMEEGELVDAKGGNFDFSKAVIILTSNLGTEILHNGQIGFTEGFLNDKSIEDRLKGNLKRILKPELLNRFDEIIIFKRLKSEDQMKVLNLLLQECIDILKGQKVSVAITHSARKKLLNIGYDKQYGARSLRRTVEKEFLDKIAQVLLDTKTRPLNIKCDLDEKGSLKFETIKLA